MRKVSLGEKNPYQYVLRWYEERFPTHNAVPEFDEKTRAVIAEELEKNTILVRENRKRLNESLHSMKNVYNEFNKNGGF